MQVSVTFKPSPNNIFFGGQEKAIVTVDPSEYGPVEGVRLCDIADYITAGFANYGHTVISVAIPEGH